MRFFSKSILTGLAFAVAALVFALPASAQQVTPTAEGVTKSGFSGYVKLDAVYELGPPTGVEFHTAGEGNAVAAGADLATGGWFMGARQSRIRFTLERDGNGYGYRHRLRGR